MQNKINITLINYQYFCGKYIKYEIEGKGKEYNCIDNSLIFEGKYLNGKRNGKGKEYNKYGRLIFEGEYLNGKRWNGKIYDESSKNVYKLKKGKGYIKKYHGDTLIYEGEYKNGKKNGKGKEFDYSGNIFFEGEYLNGKRWNGKIYDVDGNISNELN